MKQSTQSIRKRRAHLDPLEVACPGCLAVPGKPCGSWKRGQVATHIERTKLARRTRSRK
jgi:hypothetical protein